MSESSQSDKPSADLPFLDRKQWTTEEALEWALVRIRTSLDCGSFYDKAMSALQEAQLAAERTPPSAGGQTFAPCSKCGKTPPFPGGTRCQDLQCPLVDWAVGPTLTQRLRALYLCTENVADAETLKEAIERISTQSATMALNQRNPAPDAAEPMVPNGEYREIQLGGSAALEEALHRCADYHLDDALLDAPCIFCGYNGAGYWQTGTHDKNCRWHGVGGFADRRDALVRRVGPTAPKEGSNG